jgi:ankyrin repeat protein
MSEEYISSEKLNKYGYGFLHKAVMACDLEMVKLLLEQIGADVNIKAKLGDTPLHLVAVHSYDQAYSAADKDYLEIAKLLIKYGGDIQAKNFFGNTPLHEAVKYGQLEITKLLLEHGVDINVINELGQNPLHIAIQEGHLAVFKILLKHGADINTKDNKGETPLCIAEKKLEEAKRNLKELDMVEILKNTVTT